MLTTPTQLDFPYAESNRSANAVALDRISKGTASTYEPNRD